MDQVNEVAIVGAGPAGIAAAIYLKRAELHPILLEKNEPGGLLRHAYLVENYPGFPGGITGIELVELFVEQLHAAGVSITKSGVKHVHHHDDTFLIETDQGRLVSSAIIIASGTTPRKLGIKVSASIEGTRLFYDPRSIPLRGNGVKKRILVIGGGDIAFDYTLTLLNWGHEVTIISRSEPTCLPLLQERVRNNGATIHTMSGPEEIVEHREDILLRCRRNNHVEELPADFILVACGRDSNTSFLSPTLKKCIDNTSDGSQPPLPGLYFAGDVIRGPYRQTGIAVGDGIHAAMIVEHYMRTRPVKP
ncbi:MAG: NAD(P)/FAD-dependent oxidoreductase [Thermoplasmata archaeon]|nr:NAD(P)/FAD-dependent oxidoreductase [Thermoplasmata archaeon]MBE3136027.1 NAD(P)/FAD-dependent oxidoreductase [Thermoplasmata archaeon]MBE3140268.1 NAD(P)/FAD-dependent oxidoreductase [Thermoplasmata archaeon]